MTAPGTQQETEFLGRNSVSKVVPLLILLLLILLGYWLRVHNLDAFSFWTDEGLTPERSGYPIAQILRNDILIQGVVTTDTHPPLYYLILHLTRQLFGLSDFAFRYPSVLFGVLLIPLLYRLGRRMGGRAVGLLAALLAAVHPLQVYYSQEARMYSLLLLLVTGMSYVLWRAIQMTRGKGEREKGGKGAEEKGRSPLHPFTLSPLLPFSLYILLAALAVYTHYTAVFIVAAQALLWAWVLWRAGMRRLILGAAVLGVLVAIPLIPYTIPRLLAGAEANYYRVAPLTMLLDVVRFFNLGLTVDHARPLAGALNVLALGLAALGVRQITNYELRITNEERALHSSFVVRSSSFVPRFFLLSWLLAVVFGLMLGSLLFKPMYQGVRHIMAGSPAYLLLIAFGLAALGRITNYELRITNEELRATNDERRATNPSSNPRNPRNPRIPLHSYLVSRISYLLLGLLLVGYGVALVNLYADPAYVKDDFRAIVRFIETRAGNRDVIVYNNAVLLPLHEHYRRRADLAVTALPAYPQFATGAEPELAALARDYDRVWFITDPPADKRDEDKLIQAWLAANLTETINRLFPARTTEARVIAYRTTADRRPPTAEEEWGSADSPLLPFSLSPHLALAGITYDSPLELPTLWVDLIWRGERPMVNGSLLFTLTGPDGAEYFREARPILPDDDTRWDDAADNRLSYDLPLPPGLPPGVYALAMTPEAGPTIPLGPVEIAPTTTWPVAPELLFDEVPAADTNGELRNKSSEAPSSLVSRISYLVSYPAVIPWDDAVLPGNNLPLTLYWRVAPGGADLSDLRYRLEVVAPDGAVLRSQESKPGAPWLGRLPGGALLREVTSLYFRPDVEPGRYRLRWTLFDGDTQLGEPATSGHVVVEPWPLETDAPAAPYVIDRGQGAGFGPAIRLHSYYTGVPTDGLLNIAFYWQATARPDTDYVVFVHLVDEAGNIVSQIDSVPVGGARPTTTWRAGEVITDIHNLLVPDDLPPGTYHLNVGLYNPDDGTRPAVVVGGAPQPDNQLRLAPTFDLPWGTP